MGLHYMKGSHAKTCFAIFKENGPKTRVRVAPSTVLLALIHLKGSAIMPVLFMAEHRMSLITAIVVGMSVCFVSEIISICGDTRRATECPQS